MKTTTLSELLELENDLFRAKSSTIQDYKFDKLLFALRELGRYENRPNGLICEDKFNQILSQALPLLDNSLQLKWALKVA